ncbi:hypothetical protein HZP54_18495 [Elizabethkingia anophelis]|nr:hypothetical protein [Elizabethkingia anophelis]
MKPIRQMIKEALQSEGISEGSLFVDCFLLISQGCFYFDEDIECIEAIEFLDKHSIPFEVSRGSFRKCIKIDDTKIEQKIMI